VEQGVSVARRRRRVAPAAKLAASAALCACGALTACAELPTPPRVEPGGEPGAAVYTAAGAFEATGYLASGHATYSIDDDGRAALALSPDFSVPAVPGVSIFLSHAPDLSEAVKVGRLEGRSGAQRWTFKVPRGAVWSWTVLWSEELRVGVARARLRPQ
jgi:hypothetical protein